MADLTYTYKSTERRDSTGAVAAKGPSFSVKAITTTIELAASASGSTVKVARIPSNARICGASTLYFDDLATSGSPTLDIGLGSVDSNVTSDPDALNDGIGVSSAAGSSAVVKDIANYGKRAWEFVNGQSTDPGGELDVYISVKDAATNAAGSVSCELFYVVD